jgi:cobalt-zinc-cadmium resistance protein CzcA
MLRSLVATALSLRLLIVALALVVAGLGAWAFINLPVDAYPNIAQAQVKIILKAPGMTPEEVESRVITPIEMEMLGIPNQAILRSSAKYAIADITIDFTEGTDIYWARQQVAERLSGVMADLPAWSAADWRRSRHRCPMCTCLPSRGRFRFKRSANCSIGPFVRS